jgi:hypothetical protein
MATSLTYALLLATAVSAGDQERPLDGEPEPISEPAVGTARVERTFEGRKGQLQLPSPFLAKPDIQIDGDLSEPDWDKAVVLDGFTQYDPRQGAPASQITRVLVLVSDDAVLFGIQAFDDEPDLIRATLSERDGFTRSDDYIRLVLDTYNAQREAFVFTVNPFGVQHDGLWSEGGQRRWGPPIDSSPDYIWDSAATRNGEGWFAEVRIPLKSLRFPEAPVQDWGIQVYRRIQRSDFDESWAPIDSNVANELSQFGTLSGLTDLDPGLFLQFQPVVTGKSIGELDDETGAFNRSDPSAEFGFNLTYGITSNLILDGTYNPDFSQVEADAGQIVVNERFAQFLPEKRPFFLEGTEIFNTPRRVVYTRSIVDPIAGAKLTGKVGGFNLAYMGAIDEVTSSDSNPSAYVNLVRARKDLPGSSTLGLTYTDRSESSAVFNRMFSADTRLVFLQRYTLSAQVAGSADGRTGLNPRYGGLFAAELNRSGRNLSWNAEFEDITPEFRARSGFIRRTGVAQAELGGSYNWYPESGLLQRWGPRAEFSGLWDHDDLWSGRSMKEYRASGTLSTAFRGNTNLWLSGSWRNYNFDRAEYDGLVSGGVDGLGGSPYRPDQAQFQNLFGASLNLSVSRWERVRGSVRAGWGQDVIFDRVTGTPVETANEYSGSINLDLFVTTGLRGEIGVRHESLFRSSDGSRYSSATIPRVQAQYQFSKAFFVRSIVEYGAQESRGLQNPETGDDLYYCSGEECSLRGGRASNDFNLQFLGAYEPSPGTVVFLGYSRFMIEEDSFRFNNLEAQNDGFFLKVSYLLRM